MFARRVSASERLRVQSRAEHAVMRYAGDHALWHKHVHGVDLDPVQVLKCVEMDRHPNTVDFSCRRTGKTFVKELYCLKHLATHAHETEGIVAPRESQSLNNLTYHMDAIKRSDILKAWLGYDRGRQTWADTYYSFANRSGAQAYGIMAQIDGDSLTVASLEETDDMPYDRLVSRFLPMLGSTRRPGVDAPLKPQVRISGVFKGADVLSSLINTGNYHTLPIVDVYTGLELGILDAQWAEQQRMQNPEGEWMRQFLCENVAAQNWIWEKHIRQAMAVGLSAGLVPAGPLPGARYKRRGLIGFGYDHSGHGESAHASRSALVVTEQIGNFLTFPFVKSWPAGTDDKVVELDLLGLWGYFRPDYAYGDAYGLGLLTSLNDRLFAMGLTDIDRRSIGEGQSTASTWGGWAFAPIRFEGMTKHSMASVLRAAFHNGQAAVAIFDEDRDEDWRAFVRQIGNMRAEATKTSYSSYKMADPKIGDDFFDAACAAAWALMTRGEDMAPVVIEHRRVTRQELLGVPA